MSVEVTILDSSVGATVDGMEVEVNIEVAPFNDQLVKDVVGIGADGDIRAIVAHRVDVIDMLSVAADSVDGEIASASDSETIVLYRGDPNTVDFPIATPFKRSREVAFFHYHDDAIVIPVGGANEPIKSSSSLGDSGGYLNMAEGSFAGAKLVSLIDGNPDVPVTYEADVSIKFAFPSTSATFIRLTLEKFITSWNAVNYVAVPVIPAAGLEYRLHLAGALVVDSALVTPKYRLSLSSDDAVIIVSEVDVLVKLLSYANDGYVPFKYENV